jgi:tetratricopeptide (TPR) repeat protein
MRTTTLSNSDKSWTREVIDRADALEEAGDISGAIAELTAAITADPTNAHLRARRGYLFHIRKEWGAAILDFDAALAIRPEAVSTRFFRARARSMLDDLDGALRDFRECIRLDPSARDAWYESGHIYQYQGHLREALKAFECAGDFSDARERVAELKQELDSSNLP